MDGRPRQDPAYRRAKARALFGGPSLVPGRRRATRRLLGVRFSLLYEHQLPRPWDAGAEHRLLQEALAQVELADRLGYDTVWAAEHHFLEEYSHSSAPGVFLAAASQRTKNIRLGFGVLPLPPGYQHPARVAEAAATLDLVSDGRVELGTGEGSTGAELAGFGVDRDDRARPVGRGDRDRRADDGRDAVRRRRRRPHQDAAAQRRPQAAAAAAPAALGRLPRSARPSGSPPSRGSERSASPSPTPRRPRPGSTSTTTSSPRIAAFPRALPSTPTSRSRCR